MVENAQGERIRIENDYVYALTGYHPDFDFLHRVGVEVDPEHPVPTATPKPARATFPEFILPAW